MYAKNVLLTYLNLECNIPHCYASCVHDVHCYIVLYMCTCICLCCGVCICRLMCINVYGYTLGTEGSWVVIFTICSGSTCGDVIICRRLDSPKVLLTKGSMVRRFDNPKVR